MSGEAEVRRTRLLVIAATWLAFVLIILFLIYVTRPEEGARKKPFYEVHMDDGRVFAEFRGEYFHEWLKQNPDVTIHEMSGTSVHGYGTSAHGYAIIYSRSRRNEVEK